ncbi:hypothetical protein [Pseudomonas nunensis]|uniref:hypothetical protein n=1 Tax=Pseudomonas nunensis TaxID=2961896 RepID=UPI0025B01ED1|nr:hypothetical protein [Pseudomonas nunensis]
MGIVSGFSYVLTSAHYRQCRSIEIAAPCLRGNPSIFLMGDRKVTAVLATAGTFIAIPIFWTIPQSTFSGLAMGMAAINSIGQLSGMVAPVMVGIATICSAPPT